MSPLVVCGWICAGAIAGTWLLSLLTREYSWTDRLWSIVPIAYLAVFAADAGFTDVRLDVMFGLVLAWGIRLTFNFARKGGYAPGGEDYRWVVLRGRMGPVPWHLFNLFFISAYQNIILLLICLPAYDAWAHRRPYGPLDILATVVFLALLAGETVADQQQWSFQQAKLAGRAEGFVRTGLFRYSRHPNFFFEQAQWWVIFFFGAIAAGTVLLPTVAGAVLLTLLFVGSTVFTESISRSRYPSYVEYQGTTSMVVPWFPRSG